MLNQQEQSALWVTAVDWSGDAGADSLGFGRPGRIVFAFASIDVSLVDELREAMVTIRRRHGFQDHHVFKHMKSTETVKRDFFAMVGNSQLEVRVLVVDKAIDWTEAMWRSSGNDRVANSVAEGTRRLPAEIVHRQTLLLDLHQRRDGKFATQITKAVHRATRGPDSPGFSKIRCCPDSNSTYGDLVQAADMVAGALRRDDSDEGIKRNGLLSTVVLL